SEYAQTNDVRYADLPEIPRTECLQDVVKRLVPYSEAAIEPRLKAGATVVAVAPGNSLRALAEHLDELSGEDIAQLDLRTGMPLVYKCDSNGAVKVKGGEYLDPEAAAAGAAAVAAEGKK